MQVNGAANLKIGCQVTEMGVATGHVCILMLHPCWGVINGPDDLERHGLVWEPIPTHVI